ncbi:MAG: hypothetical protein M3133_01835, partial [Actinomycetota bacterium]|nr:hypothetical protein [Actinomycetota bacterium]
WGSAAAGLAAGVGDYATGLALVAVTVLALWPLDWLASSLLAGRRRTDMRIAVVVRDLTAAGAVRALLHDAGVRVDHLDMRPFGNVQVAVEFAVHATRPLLAEAIAALRARDDVVFISEEAVPGEEGAGLER